MHQSINDLLLATLHLRISTVKPIYLGHFKISLLCYSLIEKLRVRVLYYIKPLIPLLLSFCKAKLKTKKIAYQVKAFPSCIKPLKGDCSFFPNLIHKILKIFWYCWFQPRMIYNQISLILCKNCYQKEVTGIALFLLIVKSGVHFSRFFFEF